MSKGSRQRPSLVPQSQVDANWDAIFGKKKAEEVKVKKDKKDKKEKKNASKSK